MSIESEGEQGSTGTLDQSSGSYRDAGAYLCEGSGGEIQGAELSTIANYADNGVGIGGGGG